MGMLNKKKFDEQLDESLKSIDKFNDEIEEEGRKAKKRLGL